MKTRMLSFVSLAFILLFLPALTAGQDLAAIARAQKEQKEKEAKEGKKSAKVYTTDDVKRQEAAAGPQTASPPGEESSGNTILAFTKDGRTIRLAPGGDTDVIFMATWCPHSQHLKQLLNDPRTRPYFAKQKLVFLFADEWHHIKSSAEETAKRENVPAEEVAAELERMKSEGGSPYLYDAKFLDDLPGQHYFCSLPSQVNGFPMVVSTTHGYTYNWNTWLIDDRNMPEELVDKLADQYDPQKK